MNEFKSLLKTSYDELEPHEWVANHLEGYIFQNDSKEIEENFSRYAKSKYTYYQETKAYFEKIIENFCFDIYTYIGGNKSITNEGLNLIIARSSDYYLLELEEGIFSIGFLREKIGSVDIDKLYVMPTLSKYEKVYNENYVKKINDGYDENITEWNSVIKHYLTKDHATNVKILQIILLITSFEVSYVYLYTQCKFHWIFHIFFVIVSFCLFGGWFSEIKCARLIAKIEREFDFIKHFYSEFKYRIIPEINEIKSYFTTNTEKEFSIIENEKHYEIFFTILNKKYTTENKKITGFSRNFLIVLLCLSILFISIGIKKQFYSSSSEDYGVEETVTEEVIEVTPEVELSVTQKNIFDDQGFVFSDSDIRYLTEEEIVELKNNSTTDFQTTLGFARNELYARRGYYFEGDGIYSTHFNQQEWYQNIEKTNVDYSTFNEFERANLDLIIAIEKENGYR